MTIEEVKRKIKESKSIKEKDERLMVLKEICEDLANDFTYNMSLLEDEIEFVLERTPKHIKDELGYHSVLDVTRDINVTSSWDY